MTVSDLRPIGAAFRKGIVGGLAILAACLLMGARGPKAGEPTLIASPRSCMGRLRGGCDVRVRVEILRPTPEFFCPSVEITVFGKPACTAEQAASSGCDDFDEGAPVFHSKAEADCKPWREEGEIVISPPPPQGDGGHYIPATRDVPWTWPYNAWRHFALSQGEWTIKVTVVQGAKKWTLRERIVVY